MGGEASSFPIKQAGRCFRPAGVAAPAGQFISRRLLRLRPYRASSNSPADLGRGVPHLLPLRRCSSDSRCWPVVAAVLAAVRPAVEPDVRLPRRRPVAELPAPLVAWLVPRRLSSLPRPSVRLPLPPSSSLPQLFWRPPRRRPCCVLESRRCSLTESPSLSRGLPIRRCRFQSFIPILRILRLSGR